MLQLAYWGHDEDFDKWYVAFLRTENHLLGSFLERLLVGKLKRALLTFCQWCSCGWWDSAPRLCSSGTQVLELTHLTVLSTLAKLLISCLLFSSPCLSATGDSVRKTTEEATSIALQKRQWEINLWERTGVNGPRGSGDRHLRKRKQRTPVYRG